MWCRRPVFISKHSFSLPVYGILNFSKPKSVSVVRHIWSYDRGDYDLLREKAFTTNWNSLQDEDINKYANNITDKIMEISKQCIPNKTIRVRLSDPPWISSTLKKHIRIRKRLYRKAKQTNDPDLWNKFRRYRNKTLSLIRKSKQSHTDKLKEKLHSDQLSSKDWWAFEYVNGFIEKQNKPTILICGISFVVTVTKHYH